MSWRKLIKALKSAGFEVVYQRGDHMYLSNGRNKITVPRHDPIKKGTLLSIIKQAGLEKSEFLEFLR